MVAKRMARRAGLVAGVLVLGLVLGWAARTVLAPPEPLPESAAYSVVEVADGEISRSLQLSAVGEWVGGDDVVNSAEGTLTERLFADGERVQPGDALYTVDLSPVAVAVGEVPAFRDLAAGSRGTDVEQLQAMLAAAGHRGGDPNGVFDAATRAQVEAWQRDAGGPVTGAVPLGSLIFVPRLPAAVGWAGSTPSTDPDGTTPPEADQGQVGARLTTGDVVATLLPPTPTFSIDFPAGQGRLVETGMPVSLSLGDHQWEAVIDTIAPPRQDGSMLATLGPPEGSATICGDDCSAVPVSGDGSLNATITVVPPTTGPVVPTAALAVDADGTSALVTEDGDTLPVTVEASSGGQAVVSGVEPGTRIRVPGGELPGDAENDE